MSLDVEYFRSQPSQRERSRWAAERYALNEGIRELRRERRARRVADRARRDPLRRLRHRTALLLLATARRVDA